MSKITAKGDGVTITIEEKGGNITVLFNGAEDEMLLDELKNIAVNSPPMGGTFYPEPGTMLSYYNALRSDFFSNLLTDISVDGDIGEIPCEKGYIY
jgi:hypothetical protein